MRSRGVEIGTESGMAQFAPILSGKRSISARPGSLRVNTGRRNPMQQKLVIWGASGHALVVADAVRLSGEYEIVGFIDDVNPERAGAQFGGATILGAREQLD